MAFTLLADYFLVLHDLHLPGVIVFCFAHVAYILRVANDRLRPFGIYASVLIALIFIGVWLGLDGIFIAAGVYATLFITNIYVNARYRTHNHALVLTGLLLFAACDICVLIFNLPVYMNAPVWLRQIHPLIFVFYVPSQALLALSAVRWGGKVEPC